MLNLDDFVNFVIDLFTEKFVVIAHFNAFKFYEEFNQITMFSLKYQFQGHDTSTTAVGWCLYVLGKHPEIQV